MLNGQRVVPGLGESWGRGWPWVGGEGGRAGNVGAGVVVGIRGAQQRRLGSLGWQGDV